MPATDFSFDDSFDPNQREQKSSSTEIKHPEMVVNPLHILFNHSSDIPTLLYKKNVEEARLCVHLRETEPVKEKLSDTHRALDLLDLVDVALRGQSETLLTPTRVGELRGFFEDRRTKNWCVGLFCGVSYVEVLSRYPRAIALSSSKTSNMMPMSFQVKDEIHAILPVLIQEIPAVVTESARKEGHSELTTQLLTAYYHRLLVACIELAPFAQRNCKPLVGWAASSAYNSLLPLAPERARTLKGIYEAHVGNWNRVNINIERALPLLHDEGGPVKALLTLELARQRTKTEQNSAAQVLYYSVLHTKGDDLELKHIQFSAYQLLQMLLLTCESSEQELNSLRTRFGHLKSLPPLTVRPLHCISRPEWWR
jgi:hypothetical protein